METNSSSGIYPTLYHKSNYQQLSGEVESQNSPGLYKNSNYFKIRSLPS